MDSQLYRHVGGSVSLQLLLHATALDLPHQNIIIDNKPLRLIETASDHPDVFGGPRP